MVRVGASEQVSRLLVQRDRVSTRGRSDDSIDTKYFEVVEDGFAALGYAYGHGANVWVQENAF